MSVKMMVTYRSITKRERARRRFRWRYINVMTSDDRLHHFMTCDGCVGCKALLEEIERYSEEGDEVGR